MSKQGDNTSQSADLQRRQKRPLLRAAIWLCFLAPLFILSYGAANWWAAKQPDVGSIYFDWEKSIPFVAWTIIPYWSIDLFYGLSLFLSRSRTELNTLVKRLLTVQLIAVSSFVLFPLSFAFSRPESYGLPGYLFSLLEGFDKPFNQAPSLHIALLVVIWVAFASHARGWWKWLLNSWSILIGVSVLTTYQHHFIDVPTGALLGLFGVWLWRDDGSNTFSNFKLAKDAKQRRLASWYGIAAVTTGVVGLWLGGVFFWLLWPAVSFSLVALAYAGAGVDIFQKSDDGKLNTCARWLLAPYLAGAWINSRIWTRSKPWAVEIVDDVWLGRFPGRHDISSNQIRAVIDLTAEMTAPKNTAKWQTFASLDLVKPGAVTLSMAGQEIEQHTGKGAVLVCCALGVSRSAAAIVTWLLKSERCTTIDEAVALVETKNLDIQLNDECRSAISKALE